MLVNYLLHIQFMLTQYLNLGLTVQEEELTVLLTEQGVAGNIEMQDKMHGQV